MLGDRPDVAAIGDEDVSNLRKRRLRESLRQVSISIACGGRIRCRSSRKRMDGRKETSWPPPGCGVQFMLRNCYHISTVATDPNVRTKFAFESKWRARRPHISRLPLEIWPSLDNLGSFDQFAGAEIVCAGSWELLAAVAPRVGNYDKFLRDGDKKGPGGRPPHEQPRWPISLPTSVLARIAGNTEHAG